MNIASLLRDVFFQTSCCVCRSPGTAFCVECAPFVHERYDEFLAEADLPLRTLGVYRDQLRAAVLKVKDGRRDVTEALALHLAARVSDLPWLVGTVLVPLPTAAHRVRLRGLDGPAELARSMGAALGLPTARLVSSRAFGTQRGKDRAARLEAAGRFAVRRATNLTSAKLVLVDDVVTTGATLREAAVVLRRSGAIVRGALAIARTLDAEHST